MIFPENSWLVQMKIPQLGGGFIFFNFHPYLGKIPILTHMFSKGWFNHQLDYIVVGRVNYIISPENSWLPGWFR